MKRALNETTSTTNQRPKPAPETAEPSADSSEPTLKSEQRAAPGAFEYFEGLAEKQAEKENGNARKASAQAKPTKNFLANWRTVDEAQDWLEKLTNPAHVKLPATLTAPTLQPWLPPDVLKLIVMKMPARSAANWALACRYNYAMVDSMYPLNRLPTFLRFFPSSGTRPPTGLVPLVLGWLDPKNRELDRALYTPLGNRLRRAMALALRGAISDSSPKKTIALAENAVLALDVDALTGLCDLLDEYVRQHESVDVGLNVTEQRVALKRLLPLLLPLLNDSPKDALCVQVWLRLASFLPLVTVPGWMPFPEGALIALDEEALLRIGMVGLLQAGPPPDRDRESRLQLAHDCLCDYLGYARNIGALLARVANKTQGITVVQKWSLENRLMVTRHIVRLGEVLGLEASAEQALLPQSLSLLALEVDILGSKLLALCAYSDQMFFDCLNCACRAEDASDNLALSMAWRFGRLTTLALEAGRAREEFVSALKAISEKWPGAQRSDLLRQWFKEKRERAQQ